MNATRKNVFFFSLLVLVSLFQSPHAFLPVPIVSRLHSFTSISTTSATTTNAGDVDADHRGGGGDNVDTMMEIPLPIESRPFLARPPREQNHDCHDNNAFFFTRRNVISTIVLSSSSSSTCCYSFLQPSLAVSIPTMSSQGSIVGGGGGGGGGGRLAESIRQSAAKLPGYGQPDVYYPPSFLGRWRVTRMIVSTSECNPLLCLNQQQQQQQASSSLTVPFVLSYDARFIAVGSGTSSSSSSTSSSNGGGETMGNEKTFSSSRSSSYNDESGNVNVISDRAFNLASFYSAFKSKLEEEEEEKGQRKNDNTQGKVEEDNHMLPSIQKIEWSTSNPNTCTIYYSDGSWKEIRVTKRATELDVEQGTVFSSEYARVSTVSSSSSGGGGGGGGAGGIPLVQGVRVLTKWKISKEEKMEEEEEPVVVVVEGIEVVYLDDAGSATFSNSGGSSSSSSGSGSANVIMKSRLKLERIQ